MEFARKLFKTDFEHTNGTKNKAKKNVKFVLNVYYKCI